MLRIYIKSREKKVYALKTILVFVLRMPDLGWKCKISCLSDSQLRKLFLDCELKWDVDYFGIFTHKTIWEGYHLCESILILLVKIENAFSSKV